MTEQQELAVKLSDEGLGYNKIAETLGISKSTARNWVKKYGGPPEPGMIPGAFYNGVPLTERKLMALAFVFMGEVVPQELADEYDGYLVPTMRKIKFLMLDSGKCTNDDFREFAVRAMTYE